MIKKIILGLLVIIAIAGGALFLINGKDNYDASKYQATATNGINIGSDISFTLPDQFDKAHSLTEDTKKVIFVFAKATGHTVKAFLKKQNKDYLTKRDAIFVADISPMPTVIRNTFALPDLKKSDYSVLLIYDKTIAKQFKNEAEADKIAVATVDNGTIKTIKYFISEEELKTELN
jgi:glycosylphosphatidylinositol transamidase (GPIT) subunit GPI8